MQLELKEHDAVILKLSFLDSPIKVTLISAETNGLWINAHDLQDTLSDMVRSVVGMDGDRKTSSEVLKTIFVPFAQVQYALKDFPAS